MSVDHLLWLLVVLPFAAGAICYVTRMRAVFEAMVLATGFVLVGASLLLIPRIPLTYLPGHAFDLYLHTLIQTADFALLGLILYYGFVHRSHLVKMLAIIQILMLTILEFVLIDERNVEAVFLIDHLALIMVLIVSFVGSIICWQALAYMRAHEKHLQPKRSRQHHFFFVMLLFLGAMNGLVLANDLLLLYFFFELTTLCSFLLIRHDRTDVSVSNAVRALWMNSLGGLCLLAAVAGMYWEGRTLDLHQFIMRTGPFGGIFLLSIAVLCLAAFVKSAQFPFQSWLLGAMVAPTPVSALLHSSTMVKIGVYLLLRLVPVIRGSFLSDTVAVFGGFSFVAAAALAVGQSNGKKVLAYSTISNLGLMIACVGLNTPESITAGILLLAFHAPIKALLFLCVGAIEQRIDSRDIEDMRGLYATMPLTALVTVMGVIMMIMPPFGLLLSKWMAMEAAARNIYVIITISMGSALTAMYWARWAGTLMSDPFAGRFRPERQPIITWASLGLLCAGAAGLSVVSPWLYQALVAPCLVNIPLPPPYFVQNGGLENPYGSFAVIPLCLVAALGFVAAVYAVKRAASARIVAPYMSGVQTDTPGVFRGPMGRQIKTEARNYYLSSIFGEQRLTTWINMGAFVLLTLIIGGTL